MLWQWLLIGVALLGAGAYIVRMLYLAIRRSRCHGCGDTNCQRRR